MTTPPEHRHLIAEYLALAKTLRGDSPDADYRRANAMAMELAMSVPADVWRAIVRAVSSERVAEAWGVVVLVGGSGLTVDDAVWHAPGIGQKGRPN